MNRTRKLQSVVLLLALALTISACGGAPLPPLFYLGSGASQPASPAPVASQVAQVAEPTLAPTEAPTLEPTATATEVPPTATATTAPPTDTPTSAPPTATATSAPATATATTAAATATPTRVPPTATATRAAATATPTTPPRAAATATPEWPQEIVITEQQVEDLAASGSVPGLTITGLDVTFGNDTMSVFFSSLRYGFISMKDVTVEGHFEVSNGAVTFVADSISPRNLATTQIPGFVNQALGQQFTQWYVEDVTITPGQLTATVRPR